AGRLRVRLPVLRHGSLPERYRSVLCSIEHMFIFYNGGYLWEVTNSATSSCVSDLLLGVLAAWVVTIVAARMHHTGTGRQGEGIAEAVRQQGSADILIPLSTAYYLPITSCDGALWPTYGTGRRVGPITSRLANGSVTVSSGWPCHRS